jgi:hypothetical protein
VLRSFFPPLSSTDQETSIPADQEWANLLFFNRIVYRGYFLLLIIAGTLGNLLTAITLLRAKLRKYSTCQYMAVGTLLNIGVLLTNTLNMVLSQGYHFHLRSQFGFGWCRVNAFVAQWIRGMVSWILVMVAFDRFQQSKTVRRPLSKQNQRIAVTITINGIVLFVLNLHYLLFTGNRVQLEGGTSFLACFFDKDSEDPIQKFLARVNYWQELVNYTIVVSSISLPCVACHTDRLL